MRAYSRAMPSPRPELAPVSMAVLSEAFESFGHRPQFFMDALGQALSPLTDLKGRRFEEAVLQASRDRQLDDEAQMESDYLALTPLEQAILWRMLEQGARFRPYDSDAMGFYKERVAARVTVQMAQHALESMRNRTPALVWKSARGEYAVDDAAMHRWFWQRTATGNWPPVAPPSQFELEYDEYTGADEPGFTNDP